LLTPEELDHTQPQGEDEEAPSKGDTRILVVDDEEIMRAFLKEVLSDEGYVVELAVSGRDAVEKMEQQQYDIIITDIVMPNKEGLETITEIRRLQENVKIIAISGGGRFGNTDYLEIAERFGADKTFHKPLDLDNLEAAINELLAGDG